jgi:FkbM family methyltransferase
MKNKLLKYALYCQRFGFKDGTSLILKMMKGNKGQVIEVRPPGMKYPVFIRAKTSDEFTFRQIFVNGEYEFDYNGLPTTIIDAGANIGLAAVFFINRFPGSKIICLEPEPENFALLQKNVQPYPTITAVQSGLWDKTTNLQIIDSGLGHWGFTVEECANPEVNSIRAISMSDLMNQFNINSLDIVKMDIEGSEKEVLESDNINDWLSRCNTLVIELHDRMKRGTSQALFNALLQYDVLTEQKGENMICRISKKK